MIGIKELEGAKNILTKNKDMTKKALEKQYVLLAAELSICLAVGLILDVFKTLRGKPKTLVPIFKITLIFNNSSGERSIIYRDRSGKTKFGYLCKSVYKSLKSLGWYTFDNKRFYNSNYDGYITVRKTKII